MDIEYKGGNCVVISTKQATIAVDPKLSSLGLKDMAAKSDIVVATQTDFAVPTDEVAIDQPGEYEVKNISVTGVGAQRHIDTAGKLATMYRIATSDFAVAVVGHVATPLSEEQLEALGVVDVVIVPVGGSGYTLDAHQAVAVVRQLGPKIVIPVHYADKAITYEVPQMELESFIKELGVPVEQMTKLKLKAGTLPETLTAYELQRTS
ncbi:Zn-dependent hydrolase [Candidatus Saccharibacteria bacterium]|nr:MAG: Zn-dependent hydrolase [Candidatus Saccharibacteria bacterium]